MSKLKNLAIRGTIWTFLGYGTSQILRFVSNLLLTRLLIPEFFGLMALVYTFITGLTLFSDIGIGPSIIQNKRGDDPDFLNTAWTLQVIRGFGLWLACLVIAWPVATLYNDSRLLWLIPLVGLTTVVQGLNSTHLFTLNRRLDLAKLTILDLGVQVIALVVMVGWAWFNPTIWALVVGNLASTVVKMLWSHRLVPGQTNHFAWDKDAAKELFSFGQWIFIATALYFLSSQADRLILGKLFSLEMLGVYTIAFVLADLPRQIIAQISNKVIFPVISQHAQLPRPSLRVKILGKRKLILIAMAFVLTILVGFGDLLILSLYDQRYAEAAWMMPILAVGIWPLVLYDTMLPALLAVGKSVYEAQGSLLKFMTISIGLPLGFSLGGTLGAVIVVALSDIPRYGLITFGLWREQLFCLRQDIRATTVLIGLLTAVLIIRYIFGWGLPINQLFQ